MDEPIPDLQALTDLFQLAATGALDLGEIASAHKASVKKLKSYDPLRTAATFGSLLTVPELMTNGTRLEVLAHFALAVGETARTPTSKLIGESFTAIGEGICGHVEDPAEDLFVSLVRSPRGPFRVIDGVWESAGFYLQRVIGVLEGMPRKSGYDDLRNSVYALLRLSDLVCERAQLARYQPGGVMPAKVLPGTILRDLDVLRSRVQFTERDLIDAGIEVNHLAAFIINPDARRDLLKQTIGNTQLERFPVVCRDGEFFLVHPTAVSIAIRRYLVEAMDTAGMRPAMLAGLALEYASLFRSDKLLGGPQGAKIEFEQTDSGYFAGIMVGVDRGRHLSLLFAMDNLDGFELGTFASSNSDPTVAANDIDRFIDHAVGVARADPEFREGLTLIVGCGYGRHVGYALNNVDRPNWRLEMISAPDLHTLSWAPDFKPLSLWRILDARDDLERQGLQLHNVNGLLNLVAWARSLKGHLVPHGKLPDDFAEASGGTFLMVNQNSLLDLREEVAKIWDPHMQHDVSGRWVNVRREGYSLFKEDSTKPLYASEEYPAGLYETASRAWWSEVEVPEHVRGTMGYQRWKASAVWLGRAAPVIDRTFPELPTGPLLWRTLYEGDPSDINHDEPPLGYDAARAKLLVSVDADRHEITVRASKAYELAHMNSDNVAERALVAALVDGASKLVCRSLSDGDREAIVDQIVPSPLARQQHAFTNPTLRDHVRPSLPKRVTVIDELDDATSRLGLGWKVRDRGAGAWIRGKIDTTQFLNKLVSALQGDLAAELRHFDRKSFLLAVLRNHEAAAVDREHWRRTTAAVVALHDDKAAAREAIARYEFKLNAVFQATRLLAEFAICECPLEGGRRPGTLDLARFMSRAASLFSIGGWSDAIRWDVMEPRLRVTPLGDVHANWDFIDEIVEPFSLAAADTRLDEAISDYPKNLNKPEPITTLAMGFELAFLKAFDHEIGASID